MSVANKRKSENLTEKGRYISEGSSSGKKLKKSGDLASKKEIKLQNDSINYNDVTVKEEAIEFEEYDDKLDKDYQKILIKSEHQNTQIKTEVEENKNLLYVNQEGKPFMKKTMKMIVDEQRLALKFIQMALIKFQRVTDDLQELLESEIEEELGYLPPDTNFLSYEKEYSNNEGIKKTVARKRLKISKVGPPCSSKSKLKKVTLSSHRLQSESDSDILHREGESHFLNVFQSESSNTNSDLENESLNRIHEAEIASCSAELLQSSLNRIHEAEIASCSAELLQSLREIPEHSVLTPDTNFDFESEESVMLPKKSFSSGREKGPSAATGTSSRKRPCPFCGVLQAKLTRHLQLKHKHEPAVAHAINSPRDERVKLFSELRKLGMEKANERMIEEDSIHANESILEDGGECLDEFVMCSGCNGYFKGNKYKKHIAKCLKSQHGRDWEYYSPDIVLQEF